MTKTRRDFLKVLGIGAAATTTMVAAPILGNDSGVDFVTNPVNDGFTDGFKNAFENGLISQETASKTLGYDTQEYDIPVEQIWAEHALEILLEECQMINRVQCFGEPYLQDISDYINLYSDSFNLVKLEHLFYDAFLLPESEVRRWVFSDIVNMYIRPAMLYMARAIDQSFADKITNEIPLRQNGSIKQSNYLLDRVGCSKQGRHVMVPYSDYYTDGFDCFHVHTKNTIMFGEGSLAFVNRPLQTHYFSQSRVAEKRKVYLRCSMEYNHVMCGTKVHYSLLCEPLILNPAFIERI